jgi:hypothetical protein
MKAGKYSSVVVLLFLIVLCCCCSVYYFNKPKSITENVPSALTFPPKLLLISALIDTPTVIPTSTPTSAPTIPPLTATAQSVASGKTATAQAKSGTSTALAGYKLLSWQELVNFPNNHIGEHIKIYGVVFKIFEGDMFQMSIGGYNLVYVVSAMPLSGLHPNTAIWVYGTVEGVTCSEGFPFCPTDSNGSNLYQPLLSFAFWYPA